MAVVCQAATAGDCRSPPCRFETAGISGDKDVAVTSNGYGVFARTYRTRATSSLACRPRAGRTSATSTASTAAPTYWKLTYLGELDFSTVATQMKCDQHAAYGGLDFLLFDWSISAAPSTS